MQQRVQVVWLEEEKRDRRFEKRTCEKLCSVYCGQLIKQPQTTVLSISVVCCALVLLRWFQEQDIHYILIILVIALASSLAVNHMIFKTTAHSVQEDVNLLHASVLSMVEFDEDIFAAGNCFDWNEHPAQPGLFCPFAYRLPPPNLGAIFAKDLAMEYHYLGNTSEWFFLARKNAEKVIARNEQYLKYDNIMGHLAKVPKSQAIKASFCCLIALPFQWDIFYCRFIIASLPVCQLGKFLS
ncbi:hypothetical protein ACLKA6_008423 [Drosophila palustris]